MATVRLSTQFAGGQVIASSSGDTLVDANDHWILVDDARDEDIRLYPGQPATVHVFGHEHPGATAASTVTMELVDQRPRLTQTWQDVLVPAGGQVSLVHFVVQQINRNGALVAADRLANLPPEALSDLPPGVLESSLHFVLPVDGQSELEALPSLTGSVSGIAYEGDVRTPVRGARITVQSMHPLFTRVWGKVPDPLCGPGTPVPSLRSLSQSPGGVTDPPPEGSYSLQGQLTAENSIAIPEGVDVRVVAQEAIPCYGGASGHSFTGYPSRAELVVPSTEHDVIWDTGVLTGTIVGSHDFSVTGGRVYRSIDDPDPPSSVRVPIAADATYVYPGLPPGQYDLLFDTQHPQGVGTGGHLRGQRTDVEVTLGAVTVTDVSMQPTGSLQGTLVKATGEPARDARLILDGPAAGQHYEQCASGCVEATLAKHKGRRSVRREVLSDSLGRYNFAAVPPGSYTLTAIDPASDGRVTVALDVDADQVAIQNVILLAIGSANLQLRKPSGAPAVDAYVYLNAASAGGERVVGRTNGAGQLSIANIPLGDYTLRIRDPRHDASFMEVSASGTVTAGGQIDEHEVSLLAAATLQIEVIDGDNGDQPVAGARVWVRDVRNEREIGDTDAQGRISAALVLAGNYTVRARATINNVVKEESITGLLTNDDDEQSVPLQVDLRSSVVPLPRTFHDANRQSYRVEADGGAPRMPRLLIAGQPFSGAGDAVQQLSQRQLLIQQADLIAGLHVSRRVFTPRNGYFSRYVEVLENRSTDPVTVDVSVQTHASAHHNVLMTSSGDDQLDSSGPDPDRWFTIGSDPLAAARAFVASAPEGALDAPALNYSPFVSLNERTASATWSDITIPAGERVLLMHFMVEQLTPASAIAAAERLSLLPPEAIEGLVGDDALDIGNFGVPEDGISAVEPLPNLEGIVSGRVLEGDGVTPVTGINVRLRSLHPLYPREWTRNSAAIGEYTLAGVLLDTSQSIAVPIGSGVALSAQHLHTGMVWTGIADFEPGQDTAIQDIVFDSGSVFGEVTGAFQTTVSSGTVRAFLGDTEVGSSLVNNQGRYNLGGLDAGNYRLAATISLAGVSGTQITGEVIDVSVAHGQRVEQDIALVPNGGLTGRVFTFEGDPRSGQSVQLNHNSSTFQRSANTNAQGQYTFNGVPSGAYTVSTIDHPTQAFVAAEVDIVADEAAEQDLTLHGFGQVTATLRYARGEPVPNRHFTLTSPTITGSVSRGPTDAQGQRTFPVAVGAYTLRATHPQTNVMSLVQGSVAAHGEASTIELVLRASASLRVRVVDAENGDAPFAGVRVTYTRADTGASQQSGLTNADGWVQINNLHETTYELFAQVPDGRRGTGSFVVDATVDGQLVEQMLSIEAAGETQDSFSFGDERHLYSVYAESGDTLAIAIRSNTNCNVRVQVYSPSNALLAAGYGRGPSGNFGQVNEQGDLTNVPAAATGNYTMAVSPRLTNCFNTNYVMSVTVSGVFTDLSPYHGTGRVHGRLLMPDGVTPVVDGRVRLRTTNVPGIHVQRLSDETGGFEFTHLPSGSYTLTYVPAPGSLQAVQQTMWLSAGQQVERDLVLPAVTTLNVTVVDDNDQPYGAGVQVRFLVSGGNWTNRFTDENGQIEYVYVGNAPLMVRATHPVVTTAFDEVQILPADGQSIDLVLSPRVAALTGYVLEADGAPMPDAWVSLRLASNNQEIRGMWTDAQARFEFLGIPAGMPLQLRVSDPHNNVVSRLDVNVEANHTLEQDIQLNGRGTVFGQVTDSGGAPIMGVDVWARYTSDEQQGQDDWLSDYTSSDGSYNLEHLPVGRDIELTLWFYQSGQNITQSLTLQLDTHGQALERDFVFELPFGQLFVQIEGSDGLPPGGWCGIYLNFEEGGQDWYSYPCDEQLYVEDLPSGEVTVSGFLSDYYVDLEQREVSIVAQQTTEVTYRLGIVRGTVSYPDASPVVDGQIRIDPIGGSSLWGSTTEDGSYRMFWALPGEFVIQARDNLSGLASVSEGELVDIEIPVVIDFVLPESGLIEGEVNDHNGTPVFNALVYAASSGFAFDRTTRSDENGRFAFDRVALGTIDLVAIHPVSGLLANAQATLDQPDQVQEVLLQFPQPATLTGTVTLEDANPANSVCVWVTSTEESTAQQRFERSTETSASGEYSFAAIMPGHFEVRARGCHWSSIPLAIDNGQVASGASVQMDLQLGTAIGIDDIDLAESVSGYSWRANYSGGWFASPSDDSPHYAYYPAYQLSVNGIDFPWRAGGVPFDEGRTIEFSSQGMSGLRVGRSIHVPPAAGYARLLDSFSNSGDQMVQVTVRYRGYMGGWNDLWSILPATSAGRYLISSPDDISSAYASGHAAHIVAGGAGHVPESFELGPEGAFAWSWSLELPPGETQRILHYSVPRLPALFQAAQDQAESLSDMTEPDMFEGLSEAERQSIINFQAPTP